MKNKKQQLNWLVATSILISIVSCKKDFQNENPTNSNEQTTLTSSLRNDGDVPYKQSQVILGEPKRNPYTVRNMQQAYNTITQQGIASNVETQSQQHTTM